MFKRTLLLFSILFLLISGLSLTHAGEKVSWVRVYTETYQLKETILDMNLDVCSGGANYLDILVGEGKLETLSEMGYTYDILKEDINDWSEELKAGKGYSGYHNYTELVSDLNDLEDNYPDIFKLEDLGEGRRGDGQIWACKLSDNVGTDEDEPEMFVHGTTHAREPMSAEVCIYYLQQMCADYGTDPDVTEYIDELEIWVVPVMNVDGWIHDDVETNREYWRKNGYDTDDDGIFWEWIDWPSYCEGVDLNRNYTYMWGYDNEGSSGYEYDQTYRGEDAGSEPENQIIMDFCENHEFEVGISFHTYGEYILIPWGYINEWPPEPDRTTYEEIGDGMNSQIYDHLGRYYEYGPAGYILYNTNGDFTDYFYGEHEKFAFTLELNTWGQGGFYPDEYYIQPTCEMIYDVLKWVNGWLIDNYTAIEMVSFNSDVSDDGVLLTWSVDDTSELLGFNLYRKAHSGDIEGFESLVTTDDHSSLWDGSADWIKINNSLITGDNPFAYLDGDISSGENYQYKLEAVEERSSSSFGPYIVNTGLPTSFEISSLYPNPATSEVKVNFTLSEESDITVAIYDISGRKVKEYYSGHLQAGEHSEIYDVSDLSNGMYIYSVIGESQSASEKLLVIE